MESRGAGGGGGLLLLTKPGSVNVSQKPLFTLKSSDFYSYHSFRRSYISTSPTNITKNSRWDSNAETVKSQKFKFKFREKNKRYNKQKDDVEEEEVVGNRGKGKKRRWWSDVPLDMEEEEAPGILEEAIDSLWILKVFKSYGWALPPIIISWLIASGPKAFLMALALPLGQSALSFVFQKLWGRTQSKPRRNGRRRRRKPFVSYPSDVQMDEEEEGEMQGTVKGNSKFQSWVVSNDGSAKMDNQDAPPYFGGWDEVDRIESMTRPPPRPSQSRRKPSMNGKLGKRSRESDVPLLLRLLIAVFPFLSSWTKML